MPIRPMIGKAVKSGQKATILYYRYKRFLKKRLYSIISDYKILNSVFQTEFKKRL